MMAALVLTAIGLLRARDDVTGRLHRRTERLYGLGRDPILPAAAAAAASHC